MRQRVQTGRSLSFALAAEAGAAEVVAAEAAAVVEAVEAAEAGAAEVVAEAVAVVEADGPIVGSNAPFAG
jgi:hypothetical protein